MSTYSAQVDLIKDIITARCASPLFGPVQVETVDSCFGNDIVICSLVRTSSVGYWDQRRAAVLSRGRKGLFVLCSEVFGLDCRPLLVEVAGVERQVGVLEEIGGLVYDMTVERIQRLKEAAS